MDEGGVGKYALYQDGFRRVGNPAAEPNKGSATSLADSLPQMMFGFGDAEAPLPETVACMQQLVCEYVRHVTDEACKAAEVKGKLDTDCFVFAVRGDKPKYKRVKELLELHTHVKNSTRQRFTDQEMPVFHPTFPSAPKVRAIASIPRLSPLDPTELPASPPDDDDDAMDVANR